MKPKRGRKPFKPSERRSTRLQVFCKPRHARELLRAALIERAALEAKEAAVTLADRIIAEVDPKLAAAPFLAIKGQRQDWMPKP